MENEKTAALEALCYSVNHCAMDAEEGYVQLLLRNGYLQKERNGDISFTHLGQSAACELKELGETGVDIGILAETIYALAKAEIIDTNVGRQGRKTRGDKAQIANHVKNRSAAVEKADKLAYGTLHAYTYIKQSNEHYLLSSRGWSLFRSLEKLMG